MGFARWTVAAILLGLAAACAGDGAGPTTAPAATTLEPASTSVPSEPGPTASPAAPSSPVERIVTTSGDATGNRVIAGSLDLVAQPLSVQLDGVAVWVVGAAIDTGVVWVVVEQGGRSSAFLETGGSAASHPLEVSQLPAGMPPTLLATATYVRLFDPTSLVPDAAPLAGHVEVDGTPIVIDSAGRVHVGDSVVSGVAALPDTRIVVSVSGLVALMSDPTEQLTHAVIGDRIEAETVTVVDPATATVTAVLDAPDETVFEAISPLWADVDGDGTDEIVVTASDGSNGARLTVFERTGELVARSAPIGSGNRWLNQLAVAATGPAGEIEVIEVKTPHIGGVVQWYQLVGSGLELRAAVAGYSTHEIFSRNLDEGVVIDAGGDGPLDVIVPTQDDRALVALTRTTEGAEITADFPLPAPPSSNLAGVARADDTASVALATEDGKLLIWP